MLKSNIFVKKAPIAVAIGAFFLPPICHYYILVQKVPILEKKRKKISKNFCRFSTNGVDKKG